MSMAATAKKGSGPGLLRLLPAAALSGAFLLYLAAAAAAEPGLVFRVGGPRGWRVPDANTSFGSWAMTNRFHVGDELYFKYSGNDTVLVVDREAFDACNSTAPVETFAGGSTTVRLGRPGFFCFISGEPGHCEEGQRLIVRVMVHPAAARAPAPGPADVAPAAAAQPGHGGGGGGGSGSSWRPGSPSGWPGAASGAAAVAAGVALAAAMAVLVGFVVMLH